MKKLILYFLVIGLIGLTGCSKNSDNNSAQSSNTGEQFRNSIPVLATVNNTEINQTQFALYKRAILLSEPKLNDKEILAKLIDFELVSQKAKKEGFLKLSDVAAKIHLQTNQFVSDLYIKRFILNNTDKAEIKAEYEKIKKDAGGEEFLLRHIMSKSKTEIEDLRAQINQYSFEQVASFYNKNSLGGLVGWVTMGEMINPIKDAMANLADNQVSDIIKSDFGYHIILIDKRRKTEFLSFSKAKNNIKSRLITQKITDLLKQLRSNADIKKFSKLSP